MFASRILRATVAGLAMLSCSYTASAAVKITFLSRDFGNNYPHGYVEVSGATDAEPNKKVDANYGFTAIYVGPLILLRTVPGQIVSMKPAYVAGSQRHFSLMLTDAQYAQVMATVEKWRNLPRYSYNLHTHNCVSFVADMAQTLDLKIEHGGDLMMKPRSFIDEIALENPGKVNLADAYTPKLDPTARKQMVSLVADAEQTAAPAAASAAPAKDTLATAPDTKTAAGTVIAAKGGTAATTGGADSASVPPAAVVRQISDAPKSAPAAQVVTAAAGPMSAVAATTVPAKAGPAIGIATSDATMIAPVAQPHAAAKSVLVAGDPD